METYRTWVSLNRDFVVTLENRLKERQESIVDTRFMKNSTGFITKIQPHSIDKKNIY